MTTTPGPTLHEAIAPLGFLLGTWTGRGHGDYPTIDAFDYDETVTFSHVGKPFLAYTQRTTAVPGGAPLHAETGYLRLVEGTRLELVLAHPSGIVEIEEGGFEPAPDGGRLDLRTTWVRGTSTAKEVAELVRHFEIAGDTLGYRLDMAAVGVPLTYHLDAVLHRVG